MKLIETLMQTKMTFTGWILGFSGVMLIRFLLESLSSTTVSGVIGSDASTIVHYYLFFLGLTLSLILILNWFVPGKLTEISKLALFGLSITWLPPILDFLISGGEGIGMAYIFQTPLELGKSLITFFGPLVVPGITPGIRIEILIILVFILGFVWWQSKNMARSIAVVIISYLSIFAWVAAPSVMKWFADLVNGEIITGPFHVVTSFFIESFIASGLFNNFLHPTIELSSGDRYFEVLFNVTMSQVFYLIILALAIIWATQYHRSTLKAIWQNSRFYRVAHYFAMIAIGIMLAISIGSNMMLGWINVMTTIILFLSFYFAWMFAVGVNDMVDLKIDQISNKDRPLVKGQVTAEDLKNYNIFFLTWSILGGFLVGHNALFMILAFTAAYYIYSAPPLKLKRVPMLSSFLISIACLSATLAGFFLFSADKMIDAFPINWIALIIIGFTLGVNMRDIKDVEGDRQEGIRTIPVIFGDHGKQVVGAMVAIATLIVPLFLSIPVLWYSSVPAAIALYLIINQKDYSEKRVFGVYFIYIIVSILLVAYS